MRDEGRKKVSKENNCENNNAREEKWRRRVRNAQLVLWTTLILMQMTVVNCLTVRAENGEIWRAGDRGKGTQQQIQLEVQRQQTWRIQQDVVYEAVEGAAELPETVDVQAEQDGQVVTAVCSMREKTVLRERWEQDFSFPLTFHVYDAEFYEVGSHLIPYNEERPEAEECYQELLNMIGVSPEEYEIADLQWEGDAYRNEEGQLCRNAVAVGQKLVRDYRVRYEGTAVFPARRELPAELEDEKEPTQEQESLTESAVEESGTDSDRNGETSVQTETQKEEDQPLTFWQKLTRTLLFVIGIGALMFFGGLLILAFLWVVKKLRKWYTGRRK